jgi:predicted acetylornithine/succinylornithine family transaminase
LLNETGSTPDALMGLYAQPDFVLARGQGCRVWDEDGNEYLDFTAGIAVNALGHGSSFVADAVRAQLDTGLVHTSNLFRTRPAAELARLLVSLAFPGRVFFCNSGAEANEAAFKFARRWGVGQGKRDFLAFRGSFHGRLFGTLAATDRPAYQEPFKPLMPGVTFCDLGDIDGVRKALASGTFAAVIVEPIQGEGGVVPVEAAFLRQLRATCDETGTLLIFDEIQCGLGRTGKLFAWQHAEVTPDILTLAKPLAGGLPMGAVLAAPRVSESLSPGDHGTTFGGGPLVSAVAVAVVKRVSEPAFLRQVERTGTHLTRALASLQQRHEAVQGARGMGLMRGILLDRPAAPVVTRCRELGLLVVSAGPQVVRLVPPLIVTPGELDEGLAILGTALA